MNVLVLGAAGQLGQAMTARLSMEHTVTRWTRDELDLQRHRELGARVRQLAPAAIVNCAGYNNVDQAEQDQETALDVNAMELPPGWRGYGAKDYIDHPDTPARQEQVDAIRQAQAPAGRFAVQEALMPYHELLPPRFRGRNERIDERF